MVGKIKDVSPAKTALVRILFSISLAAGLSAQGQSPDSQSGPTANTIDRGSVSVANGVMYAGSNSGQMYALDAATGNILWNFASGGTVIDGPSIVDGTLYWGSGYRNIQGTGNNKVFAFSLAGEKDHGEDSGASGHSRSRWAKVTAFESSVESTL